MRSFSAQTALLRARKLRKERVVDLGADDRKAAKDERKETKDELKLLDKDVKDLQQENGQLQARIVELEESRDAMALEIVDLQARVTALEGRGLATLHVDA